MSAKAAARITDASSGRSSSRMASSTGQRAEVDRLRGELEIEASRPVPVEEIEARVDATVGRLRSFVPGSSRSATSSAQAEPDRRLPGPAHCLALRDRGRGGAGRAEGAGSWTEADRALASPTEPADDATRTKRIAALKRQLRAAEVREVDLCWQMLDAGLDSRLARRPRPASGVGPHRAGGCVMTFKALTNSPTMVGRVMDAMEGRGQLAAAEQATAKKRLLQDLVHAIRCDTDFIRFESFAGIVDERFCGKVAGLNASIDDFFAKVMGDPEGYLAKFEAGRAAALPSARKAASAKAGSIAAIDAEAIYRAREQQTGQVPAGLPRPTDPFSPEFADAIYAGRAKPPGDATDV